MSRVHSLLSLIHSVLLLALVLACGNITSLHAQSADKSSPDTSKKPAAPAATPTNERNAAQQYTGMYSFLKDGEFIQLTVEDDGRVTGFISRFGDGDSDKGAFLDQFFKSAKLEGSKLSFTTQVVHGVDYDFKGVVERGEGKERADEGYFVLKGTLTQNTTDASKKVTTHSQDVIFKAFPQNAGPASAERN